MFDQGLASPSELQVFKDFLDDGRLLMKLMTFISAPQLGLSSESNTQMFLPGLGAY